MQVCLSGCGLFTPQESVTNDELVNAFNRYVDLFNNEHAAAIASGAQAALAHSSAEFIEKASGVKSRYVLNKADLLDPKLMRPIFARRADDENSIQCDMSLAAAEEALAKANCRGEDIDAVICACSNLQRAYPAVAIEIQQALGCGGFAFDLNVACSSATFGLATAVSFIKSGQARRVLVVNPEICTAHNDMRNRDCHFIFGDACTAMVIEDLAGCHAEADSFEIIDTKISTVFSNNIRNNGGFLFRSEPNADIAEYPLFSQNGRKVFKEVIPMVAHLMSQHATDCGIDAADLKRLWLHQANSNMNRLIATKVLGHEPTQIEAPQILDRYANTSSAGSVIAFHQYHDDLGTGDIGMLCSFGAGYSVGNVVLRKL